MTSCGRIGLRAAVRGRDQQVRQLVRERADLDAGNLCAIGELDHALGRIFAGDPDPLVLAAPFTRHTASYTLSAGASSITAAES